MDLTQIRLSLLAEFALSICRIQNEGDTVMFINGRSSKGLSTSINKFLSIYFPAFQFGWKFAMQISKAYDFRYLFAIDRIL